MKWPIFLSTIELCLIYTHSFPTQAVCSVSLKNELNVLAEKFQDMDQSERQWMLELTQALEMSGESKSLFNLPTLIDAVPVIVVGLDMFLLV